MRLAVVHRGLALPVVWRVLEHPSTSISWAAYRDLLQQAMERLSKEVKVVLLADRGFVHIAEQLAKTGDLMDRCFDETWLRESAAAEEASGGYVEAGLMRREYVARYDPLQEWLCSCQMTY